MPTLSLGYRLDFASGAWRQVGVVDRSAFQSLMAELRELAAKAPGQAGATTLATGQITVGEVEALYQIDHGTKTVLVIDIVREDSAATG